LPCFVLVCSVFLRDGSWRGWRLST
jgi:hypothetical protein